MAEGAKRKAEEDDASAVSPAKKAAKDTGDAEDGEKQLDDETAEVPLLATTVSFEPSDFTLNCVPTLGGKALMALGDCGLSFFVAGARANVGIKSGRYAFEMKVYEYTEPKSAPMRLARIGVSVAGSDLIFGEGSASISFDADGSCIKDGKRQPGIGGRFGRDMIVTLLIDLNASSPTANTVCLYVDGARASAPQPLPESLVGKALYPHVNYRNVSVEVNFGPDLLRELPPDCRSVQQASEGDVVVTPPRAANTKHEVVFPVGIPEEGIFDWAGRFLQQHPNFVELSDRKIIEWALKSGLKNNQGSIIQAVAAGRHSLDKPEFAFRNPAVDDRSALKMLKLVASMVPRDYFVLEVAGNLREDSRTEALKSFSSSRFNRVARVVVGNPDSDFLERRYKVILKAKQDRLTYEWKARQAEKETTLLASKRQKEMEERRRKAIESAKRRSEALKKKREEAESKEGETKEGTETKEDDAKGEGPKDEPMEPKEESKEDLKEEAKEEPQDEPKDEEPELIEDDEPEPVAELTEEDKAVKFPQKQIPDITMTVFNESLFRFSLPAKSEGFDAVHFEWDNEEVGTAYFNDYLREKKATIPLEGLQPGQWFKEKLVEWMQVAQGWRQLQMGAAEESHDKAKKAPEEANPFLCESVTDVGDGTPLFKDFIFEDWALLQLRFELYLLVKSFAKDAGDANHPGIHEEHFDFYYSKYFSRQLVPKLFGLETRASLFDLVTDTVVWTRNGCLAVSLAKDAETLDIFVRHAEEKRRVLQRLVDAGDESAALKFADNCMSVKQASPVGTGLLRPPAPGLRPAAPGQQFVPRPNQPLPWAR